MPDKFTATNGFSVMGNMSVGSIEPGTVFLLEEEPNRFGPGRRMVNVCDVENGNIIGYVTTGQADIIRMGGA